MTDKTSLLRNRNLHVIFTVTLIAVMGVSSIAPAFPRIAADLGLTSKEVALLITFFTFPGIFLSPVTGMLADRIGRKKVLAPSLLLFAAAGTACAFTNNFSLLLFFRFLQGTGASSISSLNQTIIGDIFEGKDRITAMGYNATVLSFGTAIYPSLGGAIALLGWNYPFLLSLFGLPSALLVLFVLKSPEPKINNHFREYFTEAVKNLKSLHLMGLYLVSASTFIILYGVILTYFPFFLKSTFGSTSLEIGLIISFASLGTIMGASNLSRINRRISRKYMILTAFLLYLLVLLLTFFIRSYYLFFIPVIIYGFANGINIPTVQTMIAEFAPMEYRGAFMSLNSTVLRLGQTTGPILAGVCFTLYGLQGVFTGAIFLIILTALFLTLMIKKV